MLTKIIMLGFTGLLCLCSAGCEKGTHGSVPRNIYELITHFKISALPVAQWYEMDYQQI